MATIYKDAEHKYIACTVIFVTEGNNYCYHDFAMTKKMSADELREAVLNGALVVDVMANTEADSNTPPDKFKAYDSIKTMGTGANNSVSITVNDAANRVHYSAEYTA